MFYTILASVVAIALFLIFRDDHDTSYNKKEKAPKRDSRPTWQEQIRKEIEAGAQQMKTATKTVSTLKADVPKPTVPKADVPKPPVPEDKGPDLSFLDNLVYDENLEEDSDTFDITGLRYHCTVHDCGTIVGYVKPEPSNTHDSRAQAVIRNDGKLLGYIPRTQLDWYEEFNEENVICPFVGEIELDRSSGWLRAEIKAIIPSSREFVEEEITDEL